MVEAVPPVVEAAIYGYCLLVGAIGLSLHRRVWAAYRRGRTDDRSGDPVREKSPTAGLDGTDGGRRTADARR